MLQEERFLRIRTLLSTLSRVSTERIAQDLDVSRETVRRDILALESQGILRRVHGAVRQAAREREKRAIARAALQLLQPGQTLFIDAGSTTTLLAEALSSLSGLTIITNGLNVALKLAAADAGRSARNDVILLGGRTDPAVQATHGDTTVAEIHRYRADVALLSPVGISVHSGATSFEHHEAAVARAMAAQAKELILLADHSKVGQASRVTYASLADVGTLVTDAGARSLPAFSALQAAGCHIVVA